MMTERVRREIARLEAEVDAMPSPASLRVELGGGGTHLILTDAGQAALAEFAREPDAFLGLLGLGLSMGQWLSIPMIIFGIYLIVRVNTKYGTYQ